MIDILAAIASLVLVALFILATLHYLRRIRAGRVDPLVSPSWTEDMRPASHKSIDPQDPPK